MKAPAYSLGLLLVIYIVNSIDRQIMNILVEPVKEEFELSDGQIGWLIGGSFAFFYTFAGFPIARLADRGNRRNIIALALLVWSGMTVLCGMAKTYPQLLAARIGVGIGEAGCTPPAHSMLSDTYPPAKRASAITIYSLGVPIGMLFGLAFGGYLSDQLGWRMAFMVVGAPGLLLAAVAWLTLDEPPRGAHDAKGERAIESAHSTPRTWCASTDSRSRRQASGSASSPASRAASRSTSRACWPIGSGAGTCAGTCGSPRAAT
jgi:predicted MFS family arabinose efflux permease